MTDNKDADTQPKKVEAKKTSKPTPTKSTNATSPAKEKKSSGFPLFLSMLAIIAVGAVGFYGYQQLQTIQNTLASQVQQIENQLEQSAKNNASNIGNIESQITPIKDKLSQHEESLSSTTLVIDKIQKTLNNNFNQVTQEAIPTIWVLKEIEALSRLAERKIQFDQDLNTAITLLSLIDNQLVTLDDAFLLPLRQTLTNKLAELEQVKQPDIDGIVMKLDYLITSAETLPFNVIDPKALLPKSNDNTATQETDAKKSDWKNHLDGALATLKSMVEVRRIDELPSAIPSNEQQTLIRLFLQLQLEQAQLATIEKNHTLYQAKLEAASTWLAQHYSKDNPKVQQFAETLSSLKNHQLSPELPSLADFVNRVKEQVEKRLATPTDPISPAVNPQG